MKKIKKKTTPPSVAPMAMVPNDEMMALTNMIEMENVPGVQIIQLVLLLILRIL
jgi:hypothetical protein